MRFPFLLTRAVGAGPAPWPVDVLPAVPGAQDFIYTIPQGTEVLYWPKRIIVAYKGPATAPALAASLYAFETRTQEWYLADGPRNLPAATGPTVPGALTYFNCSAIKDPDAGGVSYAIIVTPPSGGAEPVGNYLFAMASDLVFQNVVKAGAGPTPPGPNPTQAYVTVANSPYTALSTDDLILCDTGGGSVEVILPAVPAEGERHCVKWWVHGEGFPTVTVSAGANVLEAWAGPVGESATAGTCTINQVGGEATWEWVGTLGIENVDAWVLLPVVLAPSAAPSNNTQAYVTAANSPYTALITDSLILVDNSATGAVLTVNFVAAPVAGAPPVTVKWWATGGAANAPVISGNGNQVENWAAETGETGLGANTSVNQLGGQGTWAWSVTANAWVASA